MFSAYSIKKTQILGKRRLRLFLAGLEINTWKLRRTITSPSRDVKFTIANAVPVSRWFSPGDLHIWILRRACSPALLAYNGIQYTYMALAVFEDGQYEYVQEVDKLGEDNSCLWK